MSNQSMRRLADGEGLSCPADPAAAAAAAEAPLPESPTARHRQTVLSRLPALDEADTNRLGIVARDLPVYGSILRRDRLRQQLAELEAPVQEHLAEQAVFDAGERPAGGAGTSPAAVQQQRAGEAPVVAEIAELTGIIERELAELGVSEDKLMAELHDNLPELWIRRALVVLDELLNENQAQAVAERDRYGRTAELLGLLRVDSALGGLQADSDAAHHRRSAHHPEDHGGTFADAAAGDRARFADTRRADAADADLTDARARARGAYPLLLRPDYRPGMLSGGSPADASARINEWVEQILANIALTREAAADGRLKLWDMPLVPALTWRALGLAADEPALAVLNHRIAVEHSRQAALENVKIALGFALLLAPFLAAAEAVALPAYLGDLGFTALAAGDLWADVGEYRAQSAAHDPALDPADALVSQEPSVVPIVMDVLSIVGGAGAAALRPSAFHSALSAFDRSLADAAEILADPLVTVEEWRSFRAGLARRNPVGPRHSKLGEIMEQRRYPPWGAPRTLADRLIRLEVLAEDPALVSLEDELVQFVIDTSNGGSESIAQWDIHYRDRYLKQALKTVGDERVAWDVWRAFNQHVDALRTQLGVLPWRFTFDRIPALEHWPGSGRGPAN